MAIIQYENGVEVGRVVGDTALYWAVEDDAATLEYFGYSRPTDQSPSQLPAAQAVAGGVPTLDIPALIDLAFEARCDDLRMSKYRRDGETGREFICRLVEHVEKVAGTTVADSLASALAFDYLRSDVL